MPALHHDNTPAPSRATAHERGFGMVEIIVVFVIVAIIMAIAISSLGGAKSAVGAKEASVAAAAYDGAIGKYLADHANQRPPAAQMIQLQGKPAGPGTLLDATKSYLSQVPESVIAGRVGVTMDGTANCGAGLGAPSGAVAERGWVSYCTAFDAEPGYAVRVITRRNGSSPWTSDGAKLCWRGPTAQAPRCD